MAIRSDKNIEALRIGIAEQEAKRLRDEAADSNIQKLFARHYVPTEDSQWVPMIALLPGDMLLASDDGVRLWVCGTVRRIDRFTEEGKRPAGDWWVTVDRSKAAGGSSYGHAYRNQERALIQTRGEAVEATRPEILRYREEERFERSPGLVVEHEAPVAVASV